MVCGHFRNESFVGMNVFCVCSAPAKCHTVPISFMCIAKQRSSIENWQCSGQSPLVLWAACCIAGSLFHYHEIYFVRFSRSN